MSSESLLRIAPAPSGWLITDPKVQGDPGVHVDAAVVDVQYQGATFMEGFVLSSHGLAADVAEGLDRSQLRALGTNTMFNARRVQELLRKGRQVLSLSVDGEVSQWT